MAATTVADLQVRILADRPELGSWVTDDDLRDAIRALYDRFDITTEDEMRRALSTLSVTPKRVHMDRRTA